MTLAKLIQQLPPGLLSPVGARGGLTRTIESIIYDSRDAGPKTLFVAARGEKTDGHLYLPDAAKAGATLVGEDAEALAHHGVPAYVTPNSRVAMAELAAALYHHPSEELDVIGITGTNGKTTIAHLVERLYAGLGFQTGRIGTLGTKIGDIEEEGAHTTPEAPDLQQTLRRMADAGVQKVAMEVSSHALSQSRPWGTRFPVVVFTNLTQDHLDYHQDMEAYFAAKAALFTEYAPKDGKAVINTDDPFGRRLADITARSVISYGRADAAVVATDILALPGGSEFTLQIHGRERRVRLLLPGLFNVYNALAALVAVVASGQPVPDTLDVLETLTGAPGRFEAVNEGQDFAVLVDYAHTPDALENVLRAAREITPNGRVLSVFGCGGDRDRTKRPLMGLIGVENSDFAFLTSDNPRTEEPEAILKDILTGLDGADNYAADPDRHAAIFAAIASARPGDTVVIAGKGHEDYQIIGTEKRHFDDRETAREALAARRSHT